MDLRTLTLECRLRNSWQNSALGNLPPTVYERKMAAQKPIEVSEIT
ncbi:hypothetical protein [Nitrosomonas sp.]|nr:hypothetical protein [Nitrosomonas sp.]